MRSILGLVLFFISTTASANTGVSHLAGSFDSYSHSFPGRDLSGIETLSNGYNYYFLCNVNYDQKCYKYSSLFNFLDAYGKSYLYRSECAQGNNPSSQFCSNFGYFLNQYNQRSSRQVNNSRAATNSSDSSYDSDSDRLSDRERQEMRDEVYESVMNRRARNSARDSRYSRDGFVNVHSDMIENTDGTTSTINGDVINHPNGTYSTISGDSVFQPDGSICSISDEDTINCF